MKTNAHVIAADVARVKTVTESHWRNTRRAVSKGKNGKGG